MCNIIVYGRGKTGQSLQKLLQKQGKKVTFFDDCKGFDDDGRFTEQSIVITSPGVKPSAKGYQQAQKLHCEITSELEYCFEICQGKIISVTGTNGKTTTCQMIFHVLKNCGKSTHLLGNGGVPFSQEVTAVQKDDLVVLESSSFQLNDCKKFAPFVSLMTNVAPDHLDYHGNYQSYVIAKQNNFLHQNSNCFAIFNGDDTALLDMSKKCKSQKLFYSLANKNCNCFWQNGKIFTNLFGKKSVANATSLQKFVRHNLSNALGAILACCIVGLPLQQCVDIIATYQPLPHRMQQIATLDNVVFVDDSKGTNVHATLTALSSLQGNVALILGGLNKGYAFDDIFSNSKLFYVCASGQTAEDIMLCGKKFGVKVDVFEDIEQCVYAAYNRVKNVGGTVLMSNACASFDKFDSYVQRGEYFQRVVRKIVETKV